MHLGDESDVTLSQCCWKFLYLAVRITEVPKTNYYLVTKKGNEVMSTAIKFRQLTLLYWRLKNFAKKTRSCGLVTMENTNNRNEFNHRDSQIANEIFSKDLEQMLTLREVK